MGYSIAEFGLRKPKHECEQPKLMNSERAMERARNHANAECGMPNMKGENFLRDGYAWSPWWRSAGARTARRTVPTNKDVAARGPSQGAIVLCPVAA
jgi:hypothetical protein